LPVGFWPSKNIHLRCDVFAALIALGTKLWDLNSSSKIARNVKTERKKTPCAKTPYSKTGYHGLSSSGDHAINVLHPKGARAHVKGHR